MAARSRRAALFFGLAIVLVHGAAGAVEPPRKRVVVESFVGPEAARIRAAVVADLGRNVELIDEEDFGRAVQHAAGVTRPDRVAAACGSVRADAVVEGEISHVRRAWRVEIVVRTCESGERMLPGGRAEYSMRTLGELGSIRSSVWSRIGDAIRSSRGRATHRTSGVARSRRPSRRTGSPDVTVGAAAPAEAVAPCLFEEDEPPEGFPGYGDWVRRRNEFLVRCERQRQETQRRLVREAQERRRQEEATRIAEERQRREQAEERRRASEERRRASEERQRVSEERRERLAAARRPRIEERNAHRSNRRDGDSRERAEHEHEEDDEDSDDDEEYDDDEYEEDDEGSEDDEYEEDDEDSEDDEYEEDDEDFDDDDAEQEEARASGAEQDGPSLVDLRAGVAYAARNMDVEVTASSTSRTYSAPGYPELTLSLEVFPIALVNRWSVAAGLGLFGLHRRDISVQTTGVAETGETVDVATHSEELLIGAMYRMPLGRSRSGPSLTSRIGYGYLSFELDPSAVSRLQPDRQVPSMVYRNFVLASSLSIPFGQSGVAVEVGGQYRPVVQVGQAAQDQFGDTTGGGYGFGAHLSIGGTARFLVDGLVWSLEGDYMALTTRFSGTPREGPAIPHQFGVGTDRYLRAILLAGYRFR